MSSETKNYTPVEEFFNAFSHALGALFSIYAIVILATNSKTPIQAASTAIFGASMFLMFQSSVCYHAMVNDTAKNVFRRIDHSAIYLLIAGSYTPIFLLTISPPNSIALLAMMWYLACMGIVFSCMTLKFKHISTGIYLIMGWFCAFLFYHLWTHSSHEVVYYLLGGGLFYSIGCIFYALKKKFMHTIWHLFVLGGTIMHFIAILELLKVSKF